ncbi:MAG: CRTAC1 family protein [Flavobacteriaceae bacterium]
MRTLYFVFLMIGVVQQGWSQTFTDITKVAGINHYFEVYEGMFGGGAAVLDYNKDGFEDIYITGGMQADQLLLNQGDGTFLDQLKEAKLEETLQFVTQGVASADFNKDGWNDLFITTITTKGEKRKIPRAHNLLFINQGNGTFKDESAVFGIQNTESFSTGIAIGDFNIDGYPDVYVGNYFTDYDGGLKEISDATIVNAGKTAKGYLYENQKGRSFKEVSKTYGLNHRGFSFGGVFTDYDNDHDLDLIINNDFGYKAKPNYLLENQYPKQEFIYVEEQREMDLRINAMGAATADINADGWLDYFISNIRFNRFMIWNPELQIYQDQAESRGTQLFTISWGTNFADFDHDGDIDLFVSNGDLNPNCVPMNNFYFENTKGNYEDVAFKNGLKDYGVGRGSVVLDIENDGDLDLLVVSQKPIREYGPESITRLYRNDWSTEGNSIQIQLKGKASTTEGFGARIEIFSDSLYLQHEIDGGNTSHLSHNTRVAHFGLGNREQVDSIKVTWPGGHTQKMGVFLANQKLILEEDRLELPKDHDFKFLLIILIILGTLVWILAKRRPKTAIV